MGDEGCAICPAAASGTYGYTVANGKYQTTESLCESCATVVANVAVVEDFTPE